MSYNLDFLKTDNFAEALNAFQKKQEAQGRSDCTCVGFFTEGEGFVNDHNPQCHIGLTSNHLSGESDPPLMIFSGFQEFDESSEEKQDLLEFWFAYQKNHPILGKGVLNESWEEVYDNGWWFRTDLPKDLLCASIFWTRWPTEFAARTRAMMALVKAGCHPDMAFLVSTIASTDEEHSFLTEGCASGHMPCASHLSGDLVKHFLRHETVNEGKLTYREDPSYNSIDGVFSNNRSGSYGRCGDITNSYGQDVVTILMRHSGDKWEATADIFFTEDYANKKRRASAGARIPKNNYPALSKQLNAYREEVINGK